MLKFQNEKFMSKMIYDLGVMATGAINVVRGSRSSDEELLQIYNHSERFVKLFCLMFFFILVEANSLLSK